MRDATSVRVEAIVVAVLTIGPAYVNKTVQVAVIVLVYVWRR